MEVGTLLDGIITRGEELNREWITRNPTHWLTKTYEQLHNKSTIFLTTSCEITAMMLRSQLSESVEWEVLDATPVFNQVHSKYPVFQISIGEDCHNNEHIVTITNGWIIQSYYGRYTIEKNRITPNIIRAINDTEMSEKSYATITRSLRCPRGLTIKGANRKLRVYYWIPSTNR